MARKKIARVAIPDQICELLIERIHQGELKPGDRIPSEYELAEELGVSRVSLKIALQKLNTLGVTETRIGDGTYVCEFNMRPYFEELINNDILNLNHRQLNEFRVMLEYSVMHLAISKKDLDSGIQRLEDIYHRMHDALMADDLAEYHTQHFHFHQCICDMSENPLYQQLYSALSDLLYDLYKINTEKTWSLTDRQSSLVHHYEILDCFKRHDVKKCLQIEDELLTDPALLSTE